MILLGLREIESMIGRFNHVAIAVGYVGPCDDNLPIEESAI